MFSADAFRFLDDEGDPSESLASVDVDVMVVRGVGVHQSSLSKAQHLRRLN